MYNFALSTYYLISESYLSRPKYGLKTRVEIERSTKLFLISEFCCKMFLYKFIHQAESACNEQHRQML